MNNHFSPNKNAAADSELITFSSPSSTKRGEYKGRELDTLAEFGTESDEKTPEYVVGIGSDINDTDTVLQTAKKKFVTQNIVLKLIDIAKDDGNVKMAKYLWNAYHCRSNLKLVGDKLHGKYCKTRICTICNSNRKAELINKYLPVLKNWEDPHFLTLTVRSPKKERLDLFINKVIEGLQRIIKKYYTRNQRGTDILLYGLRSLECNFNQQAKTYNPHFHILVPNKEIALILKKEWLMLWTSRFTASVAQKIRKVHDTEKDLIEIIKYSTTIFTEKNKHQKKRDFAIYIKAMYNILCAMQGHHTIEPFGFKLPKKEKNISSLKPAINPVNFIYNIKIRDWVDKKTGELLTGYNPNISLLKLLQHEIDVKNE